MDEQLARGRRSGTAGAIVGLISGVALTILTLLWGIPSLASSSSFEGRATARLIGFGLSIGLILIIVSIRNLKTFSTPKSPH